MQYRAVSWLLMAPKQTCGSIGWVVAHLPVSLLYLAKKEDLMPLKPLVLREMTPEEREKRDLAIKQARDFEKADAAEKAVKLGSLSARKK